MTVGEVVTVFDPAREVWVNRLVDDSSTLGAYATEREASRDARLFRHFVSHFAWPTTTRDSVPPPTENRLRAG